MKQDQKFIDSIIMQRMAELYDNWKEKPISDLQKVEKVGQGYQTAISTLTKQHRDAVETYLSEVTADMAVETEFFYNSGVRDGYKLCQYIENMLSGENV